MDTSLKTRSLALGLMIGMGGSVAAAQSTPGGFTAVLPADVRFAPNPALLAGGQTAILLGDVGKAGPYVARTKFPPNFKMMPHTHPDVRTYTVLSGSLGVGFGDKFDTSKVTYYPAGSVFTLPANAPHFNATTAKGAVFQINSVGPSASIYVDPADDPRKK